MKKTSFVSSLLFILFFLSGCEKDYLTPQKVEINFPVSFTHDIMPIFAEDCSVPTCHVNGGATPNLTADKAYDEITGLGYVDTSNAVKSVIYTRITSTSKPMPPNGRLTPDEIGYILAWIKQGAQQN